MASQQRPLKQRRRHLAFYRPDCKLVYLRPLTPEEGDRVREKTGTNEYGFMAAFAATGECVVCSANSDIISHDIFGEIEHQFDTRHLN